VRCFSDGYKEDKGITLGTFLAGKNGEVLVESSIYLGLLGLVQLALLVQLAKGS
jgi:hypothetical protein